MQGLEQHVAELKKRLKISGIALILASGTGYYFSSDILKWLQADLGFQLHALTAYEVFYTELMIAFLVGFFTALPIILYQVLMFLKPGLKDSEYRVLRNYLPFSVLLFILGAAFAYQFIVKASLNFFQSVNDSATVSAVWGLQNTLGFALKISAFTGIFFQIPIVAVILAKAGLINSRQMRKYRAYFIIAVLLISATATPPDMVSQVLVTGPVIGLYQASIFMVARINR